MTQLMSGAIVAGYAVAALFFLKYWTKSQDRLFLLFSVAFTVLAGQRIALELSSVSLEDTTMFYVVRFIAYSIILFAIWDKNRSDRGSA